MLQPRVWPHCPDCEPTDEDVVEVLGPLAEVVRDHTGTVTEYELQQLVRYNYVCRNCQLHFNTDPI